MSRKVLLCAFEKAENEIGSNKKTHLSTHISDMLQEEYGLLINERTLRDYYTNFNKNEEGYYTELKPRLIVCLCKYLGYRNYADFVMENPEEKFIDDTFKTGIFSNIPKCITNCSVVIFSGIISVLSLGLTLYFEFGKEPDCCKACIENFSEDSKNQKNVDENIIGMSKKQNQQK